MIRLQAKHGTVAWQHAADCFRHELHKADCNVGGDERRGQWSAWIVQVHAALLGHVTRRWIGQLGALAAAQAISVAKQNGAAACAAFKTWLQDGPATGLGRQHKFTRVTMGWTASTLLRTQESHEGDSGLQHGEPLDGEAHMGEGVCAEFPDASDVLDEQGQCGGPEDADRPATLQEEAENDATRWGAEWLCDAQGYSLPWPEHMGQTLPPLDVTKVKAAIFSFSASTGLGWDRMHPHAWLRAGPAALGALLHLLQLVEQCGRWPAAIGHVMIVLLAKPAGGFRPIGLFPSVVRIWMRVRLADAVGGPVDY